MDKLLHKKTRYCDLGAWIGPTVLFAANRCEHVTCVEPDPIARKRLKTNLSLNNITNVQIFNQAVSHTNGQQRLASPRGKLGDSMATLLRQDPSLPYKTIQTITWQNFITKYRSITSTSGIFDFIKIDIEGAEFTLIPTMEEYLKRHTPTLYLSLHPHLLQPNNRKKSVQKLFHALTMYKHCFTPDLIEINTSNLEISPQNPYRGTFLFTNNTQDILK
ncbi:MAG: FkbM family methyltransferase [Desulfovibrio sp.]